MGRLEKYQSASQEARRDAQVRARASGEGEQTSQSLPCLQRLAQAKSDKRKETKPTKTHRRLPQENIGG